MKLNRFEKFLIALFILWTFSWVRAHAQDSIPVMVLKVANYPIAGQTLCRGSNATPVIIINAELPDSEAQATVVHEMVHVRQMFKNGGCLRAALRYENDPGFRFDQEAEAYCEQIRWWVKRGNPVDYNRSVANVTFALRQIYSVSVEVALLRFMSLCPQGGP